MYTLPEELPKAGQFGDTFGAVTAFFTGVGFLGTAAIIYSQLAAIRQREKERTEDIRRRAEDQTKSEKLQRRITTMSMVYDLENEFGSERMRTQRHIACKFFLAADRASCLERTPRRPTPEEDLAIRDIAFFLERVAHFTNERLVDDDLVLSVFGSRLLVYWKYTNRYVVPFEGLSRSSLRLVELRKLCKCEDAGIKRWLRTTYGADAIEDWYDENELRNRLKREQLRSSRVHDRDPFIRRIF